MVGLTKPSLRWDNHYGLTHFIVPPVAKENKAVSSSKQQAPKQKVKKHLLKKNYLKSLNTSLVIIWIKEVTTLKV